MLAEIVAQSGERLTVELLIGAAALNEAVKDLVRFQATHDGDPSSWLGGHAPDRAQAWRLWNRI
jgi:hypothetical protein